MNLISDCHYIKIKGKPTIYFLYKETINKAWNQNEGIPKYLREFLNNIRIEKENRVES